ncbi:MAG TPA: GNAT family N-acetyltransferase [Ligilactobacillus acidipiscis]|uniref:GNAT family N-acetyltransferase n=1 Tax=Ligilactobacillus acidipiscis TaxID=89059 RepID=A0A921F8D2_9LACO|nr:GNAT family N-acetyltransferase [Ligilactobacillus acidipiscis]
MIITFSYKIDQDISLVLPRPKVDAEPLFKLVNESRKELEPWLPWVKKIKSVEDEQKTLNKIIEHFGTGYSLNTIILFQNQPAGSISFNNFQDNDQSTEIGYWLGTKFVGKGIVHRAISGMCNLGFNDYEVHKIVLCAAVENQKSNHTAQKAGFHLDGVLRADELLQDGFHDENIYSLLKDEWETAE